MNDEIHAIDNSNNIHDENDSESITISSLNEIFASQMNKRGVTVETVPIGSLNLEFEEYYNNDIGSTPRIITNRGCIKIKNKEISMIQIIQRN